jgi:hypothetical protein
MAQTHGTKPRITIFGEKMICSAQVESDPRQTPTRIGHRIRVPAFMLLAITLLHNCPVRDQRGSFGSFLPYGGPTNELQASVLPFLTLC